MIELRTRSPSRIQYNTARASAYRNTVELHDPALWLSRDPEAEEKMLRDTDISHAVTLRQHMIAGRDFEIAPRDKPRDDVAQALADIAVEVATEGLSCIDHFSTARLNLSRAFFSGQRFSRIVPEARDLSIGDGQLRTWLMPRDLVDMDKRTFRKVPHLTGTGDDRKVHTTWERYRIGPDKWMPVDDFEAMSTIKHTYADDQSHLGYGKALRESIGLVWYSKEHVFQESISAVERFAQGLIHAQVDGLRNGGASKPNSELVALWQRTLADMRAKNILVSDKSDVVSTIPMDGQGWQILGEMRQELRSMIFTIILGANLTTSANEGGSFALAKVQENSSEVLIQFDRQALEETLTRDLLGWFWWANHRNLRELGIADEKPRFNIKQEKMHDPTERSQTAATLLQAGVSLVREDVHDQTGFRMPRAGDDVIEPTPAAAPMPMGGAPLF